MITLPRRIVTLTQPPRITFGVGCASEAIATLARSGCRRVFIVTSPSVIGSAESFAKSFRAQQATVEIVTGVPPEPTTVGCENLRNKAHAFGPDLVVGVGGGSVLDVAKLIAALHDRPEVVTSFYGIGALSHRRTALVCVPTTGGTGSEVSPNALLYDETAAAKKAIISPALVPDEAIVDPGLMVTLPPALTATTGIDALTHCLEAYANRAAHPATDLHALEGVRLIGANLVRAVNDGPDLAARSAVALGSLYGGLCLGPVNTAAVHALAYPLGGEFHLAHGLSIALLLPHVIRFNLSAELPRYAMLARALGSADGNSDANAAAQLPAQLTQLLAYCRVPVGLSAHGIPHNALARIADAAMQVTRLLDNNPRVLTRDDALRIYESAYRP